RAKRLDIRLPHYRDVPAALINGLRGMIAVGLLSVFWIYTAWPNGSQLFGAMVPICALLGASDRQQADSIDFFIGVLIAAIAGLICGYGLLTQISGFPLLVLAMAPFLLAGAYFSTRPKTAGIATGFLIFFVTFVGPRNPMQFDLASYLNTVFANLVGMAALLPVFRVVFPQHHGRSARNLAHQLVVSLMRLAKRPTLARLLRWEHQAHDRLTTIALRLLLDDADRPKLLNGGFAAIRIGRDLARTKAQIDRLPLNPETRAALRRALAACRHLAGRPGEAVQSLWMAANQVETGADALPADDIAAAHRAVAALRECANLLVQHEAFFTGRERKAVSAIPLRLQEAM
ncbi:MAG TPA: FUSC family protein, partial [Dongiaceae bacterium]|nr:FUSC family protein [Dongiaceae bacterium]